MKLSRVKGIVKRDGACRIVQTEETTNMISQWVGGERAFYPVREVRIGYSTLQVAWELPAEEWQAMIECAESEPLLVTRVLEHAPATIDKASARDNVAAVVNGWTVVVQGGRVWCVDGELLTPCRGKKHMHLVPVEQGDILDENGEPVTVPEGVILVYDGAQLEGVVCAAAPGRCREIVNKCRMIGDKEPVGC